MHSLIYPHIRRGRRTEHSGFPKVRFSIHHNKTAILPTLNRLELGTPRSGPIIDFIPIPAGMARVGLHNDLGSIKPPFHGRKISVALERLANMVDAVACLRLIHANAAENIELGVLI